MSDTSSKSSSRPWPRGKNSPQYLKGYHRASGDSLRFCLYEARWVTIIYSATVKITTTDTTSTAYCNFLPTWSLSTLMACMICRKPGGLDCGLYRGCSVCTMMVGTNHLWLPLKACIILMSVALSLRGSATGSATESQRHRIKEEGVRSWRVSSDFLSCPDTPSITTVVVATIQQVTRTPVVHKGRPRTDHGE